MSALEIFFSYAHIDEKLRKKLEEHLSILKWEGNIVEWYDREIVAGQEWAREIDTHLNTAQIILLLVSSAFLASHYCYSIEMKQAIERHERREAHVIPIILRPVHWQGSPFGKLQALPTDGKAVTSHYWHNQDEAFYDVAEGILKVVNELKNKPSSWEQSQATQFHQSLQEEDVFHIPSGRVRETLYQLADDYRRVREELPSGHKRTRLMSSLAERMRTLTRSVEFSPEELNSFLQSKMEEEGRRLLGVSIIRRSGDANYFEQVVQIIGDPYSAFEQWQALRAMEQMMPSLKRVQKKRLQQVLNKQRNYDVTKKQWILPDSDRGRLSSELLSTINIEI